MRFLILYKPIVNAITESPIFNPPSVEANNIESSTLMGPFFALSPLKGEVAHTYFPAPKSMDRTVITNTQGSLRMQLQSHQNELLEIANQILKAGKEPRERLLNWFAACMNLNHKRRAMQVDQKAVSSDGFMFNVTVCLDQLCEPFMDASFSKIDRIDVSYLRRNPRVDIKEETKLNADQNMSDDFYSKPADGTTNFISEVFFLNLVSTDLVRLVFCLRLLLMAVRLPIITVPRPSTPP